MTPKLKRLLAEVITGLAALSSINSGLLGKARDPYFELRGYFHLFGYPSVEEVEEAIEARLKEDGENYE